MKVHNRSRFANLPKREIFFRALACGLVVTLLVSVLKFSASCDTIRDSVLRLHILANSDLEEDQQLKLKVRDGLLLLTDDIFAGCENKEAAKKAAEENIGVLTAEAERIIAENGYDYDVTVRVEKCVFDTRDYDDFSLPAGCYDAIRVVIGSGEGHNWWCVMFPPVCVPACCDSSISDVLDEDRTEIVEHKQQYEVGFKVVEWYEEAKEYLKNR